MRLFLIILVGLLLIAGGLVGAFYALGLQVPYIDTVQGWISGTPAGQKRRDPSRPPIYVAVQPERALVIPVVRGDRIERQILVRVTVAVADATAAKAVEANRDTLSDVYITELTRFINLQWYESGEPSPEDSAQRAENIKARLRVVSNRVLGEGVVEQVLLTEMRERPTRP